MRLSNVLFAQHIGRMFRDHWKVQGKRLILDNGSLASAQARGLEVEDALNVIKETARNKELIELRHYRPKNIVFDETHPDYQETPCVVYGDHSVLVEGMKQAQVLTNTVLVDPELLSTSTDTLSEQDLPPVQDKLVKRCIRSSLLFEAMQEKLPKRHDPLREAWNFPRDYGISDVRKNYLLTNRLLQLCSACSPHLLGHRSVYHSAKFNLPLTLPSGERILFSVTGDALILADKNPSVISTENFAELEIPNIHPLLPTISLESTNIYKFDGHNFPVNEAYKLNKVHTIVLHYNHTQVKNIFETPVTVDQILSRTLIQSWIIAMCQATQGSKGELSEPVTVQTVQTDGTFFHFSVFKLSSTSLAPGAPRNYFWSFPLMNIFDKCDYEKGVPVLEGYNPTVFKTLLTFYNNS